MTWLKVLELVNSASSDRNNVVDGEGERVEMVGLVVDGT